MTSPSRLSEEAANFFCRARRLLALVLTVVALLDLFIGSFLAASASSFTAFSCNCNLSTKLSLSGLFFCPALQWHHLLWLPNTSLPRCGLLNTGGGFCDSCNKKRNIFSYSFSHTDFCTSCLLLTASCLLLRASCLLVTASCLLVTASCLLSMVMDGSRGG